MIRLYYYLEIYSIFSFAIILEKNRKPLIKSVVKYDLLHQKLLIGHLESQQFTIFYQNVSSKLLSF